ncbi:hypothetical protein EGI32_13820 [Ferruginibacter sp. HRS2-29]|nr:hypothetical protein [Ferruginibacter sp. HRS2-29]
MAAKGSRKAAKVTQRSYPFCQPELVEGFCWSRFAFDKLRLTDNIVGAFAVKIRLRQAQADG